MNDPAPTVVALHLGPTHGAPLDSVDRARAIPGQGLEGDRHFDPAGVEPHQELTLIEAEQIERYNQTNDTPIDACDARRNVVTRGVDLNALVDREFTLGGVRARGIELCEPCNHLAKVTGHGGIVQAMVHRAGLRAAILTEGEIRVGDAITT